MLQPAAVDDGGSLAPVCGVADVADGVGPSPEEEAPRKKSRPSDLVTREQRITVNGVEVPSEEDPVTGGEFVPIIIRSVPWLNCALGSTWHKRLKPQNIFTELRDVVRKGRGKKSRAIGRRADVSGSPSPVIDITVRDIVFTIRNHVWPIYVGLKMTAILNILHQLQGDMVDESNPTVQTTSSPSATPGSSTCKSPFSDLEAAVGDF